MLEKSNILNCRIAFSGNESVEKIKLDAKKQLQLIDEDALLNRLKDKIMDVMSKYDPTIQISGKEPDDVLSEIEKVLVSQIEILKDATKQKPEKVEFLEKECKKAEREKR